MSSIPSSIPLMSPPQAYGTGNQQQIDVQTLAQMDPKSLELIRDILTLQNQPANPPPPLSSHTYGTPIQQAHSISGPPVYGTVRQQQPQYTPIQPNYADPRALNMGVGAIQQYGHPSQPQAFFTQQERVPSKFEVEADKIWNKAIKNKSVKSEYYGYLEAIALYEKAPVDRSTQQSIVTLYGNMLLAEVKMRHIYRQSANAIWWVCLINGFTCCIASPFILPYVPYRCCVMSRTGWVDTATTQSHFHKAFTKAKELVQGLLSDYNLHAGSDKNSLPQPIRASIAKAYSSLGLLYTINDSTPSMVCDCCINCCLEGSNGTDNVSGYSPATAVANYRLAMEWDPQNTEYASRHQALDSKMKAPTVINYYGK